MVDTQDRNEVFTELHVICRNTVLEDKFREKERESHSDLYLNHDTPPPPQDASTDQV